MPTPWDQFFKDSMKKVAEKGGLIVDIGGGLRISKDRGNIYDRRRAYLKEWLADADYKIMDPVPTYKPDIVGDIHRMPFADRSVDSFVCLAVLEHVENPLLAITEMKRTLKDGGYCFLYVPFLFSYHAEPGYYHDYYRFTRDGIRYLLKDFSEVNLAEVRGPFETLSHLLPGAFGDITRVPARLLDRLLNKQKSNQTSGFYALARK